VTLLQRRRRQAELLVIGALAEIQPGTLSGYPLMKATGLSSGRLYEALTRLEGAGRITSQWADMPYPRRRLYRLAAGTEEG
jgi:DNA-binding PadR family transcriptional regulator